MKRAMLLWTLCVVSLSGLKPNAAAADQLDCFCRIQEEADSIRCWADQLQNEFRGQFRCSGVYRRLITSSGDIESSARRIRNLAHSKSNPCELRDELACIRRSLGDLRSAVDEAKFRVARGLDAPLTGCTKEIDRLIGLIFRTSTRIESCLAREVVDFGNVWGPSDRYSRPDYSHVDRGPTNYGGSYSRYDLAAKHGFDYGFNRELDRDLDRGRGFESGIPRNSPVGMVGPRGNGVDMDERGLVLRIGEASFRVGR